MLRAVSARLARLDPGLAQLRVVALAMVATLGSYGSALALDHAEHLGLGVVVLAVVLSLTLSRTHRAGDAREWLLGLGILSLLALAADEVGSLLVRHQNAGEALFVLAIGGSIWIRRFGPLFARAGTLVALPFVALLITPAVPGAAHEHLLWSAVTGMIAYLWVTIVREAGERAGLLARPADPRATRAPRPRATRAPARSAVQAPAPRAARASKPARRRLPASTRMAIQMGAALAASFAVGRALFGHHWSWTVLSAFIVCSGNRGRGDVLYKSVLRITGAATGTVLATLIAGNVAPGDSSTVVVIFVLLGIASWLRAFSYAYWAAAITAVLALLYGYFGESGTHLLGERLEGILLGAGIAVAVSWVLLPVRTSDVLRRRIANTLAALGELLGALGAGDGELGGGGDRELLARAGSFEAAVNSLEEIARPLEIHRLLIARGGNRAHLADTLDAARRLRAPVEGLMELVAGDAGALAQPGVAQRRATLARGVGAARRALAGRYEEEDGPRADVVRRELQLPESAFEELEAALRDLARSYREARAPA
jgi:hypothetical protein